MSKEKARRTIDTEDTVWNIDVVQKEVFSFRYAHFAYEFILYKVQIL